MSDALDNLIDQLASEGAREPLPHPAKQAVLWLGSIVAYLIVIGFVSDVRPDMAQKLASPYFVAELILLLSIAAASAVAALCLARPDSYQMPRLRFVPLGFLIPWAAVAFVVQPMFDATNAPWHEAIGEFDCAWHLCALSLMPVLALLFLLRKGAATQFFWAAGMACLSSTAIVYLSMRILEHTDDVGHLLFWHALPAALFSALGAALERFILRWK
jgi:hypothetical protein